MEKYVLFSYFGNYAITTTSNYNAEIMDGNAVAKFKRLNGFSSIDIVLDYIKKYYNIPLENIIVKAED